MKKFLILPSVLFFCTTLYCQNQDSVVYEEPVFVEEESNDVEETFLSTRIINGHSVETLKKGTLEFRVEHKFGDLAGKAGGANTMYGLDNVSDIRIAFEYGITNKLNCGFGRSKGTGAPYRSLLDGYLKYRILHQQKKGIPVSLTVLGTTSYTYMPVSPLAQDISHFNNKSKLNDLYRFAYSSQVNIARKFGKKLTLAVLPTMIWRNYVAQDDENLLFSIGGACTYFINPKSSITVEYFYNVDKSGTRTAYLNPFSIAYDWMTFGHNFKVFLTNAEGFGETQYIPYTNSNWNKGQFRIGFCLGRKYMKE